MSENPAAFPSRRDKTIVGGGRYRDDLPGMTLRDYFAAKALTGIGTWMPGQGLFNLNSKEACDARARWAYLQADAMLAARGVTP